MHYSEKFSNTVHAYSSIEKHSVLVIFPELGVVIPILIQFDLVLTRYDYLIFYLSFHSDVYIQNTYILSKITSKYMLAYCNIQTVRNFKFTIKFSVLQMKFTYK